MNLRDDIKKQLKLLTEQTYVLIPGTPTLGKRIYGCACDIQPGVPPEHWSWSQFGTEGWDSTTGTWADWSTTYPLTDGMGRVYTNAEYQLLPQIVRNSLWAYGALSVGPVNSPVGYLFCPPHNGTSYSTWYQGMNRIVDCQLPQDGQVLAASSGINMKIAHNGAFLDEFKPWIYETRNQSSAPCPSGGDQPLSIDCSHNMSNCSTNGGVPACSELPPVLGCTDSTANNYDPLATQDDGSCTFTILGCTDPAATNYDPNATQDDGSCTYDFSDPNIHQQTRICTCEDNPIDVTGSPNNYFACNGGQPLETPLRFSSTPAPLLNLINHQAQVGNLINDAPPHTNGNFPSDTLWLIVDVLGVGTGGAPAVVFLNQNGCPENLPTSGNVPGIGFVGTKPTDDERKKWEKEKIEKGIDREEEMEKELDREKLSEEIKRINKLLR
tara:strand:+ start:98 stop:1414 length:1317 start_codon:yes stop_codon:yes gene_type:complete